MIKRHIRFYKLIGLKFEMFITEIIIVSCFFFCSRYNNALSLHSDTLNKFVQAARRYIHGSSCRCDGLL